MLVDVAVFPIDNPFKAPDLNLKINKVFFVKFAFVEIFFIICFFYEIGSRGAATKRYYT